jgi:hypothetical protein
MGCYTLSRLSEDEQQFVIFKAQEICQRDFKHSFDDILLNGNRIVIYNFIVYGMMERQIRPALGSQLWFWVKNPFVESIGSEELLDQMKRQLEKEYGVPFDSTLPL